MSFRAGELDQRVKIMRPLLTSDGMGGNTETFTEVSERWALVRPLNGKETDEADRLQASAVYLFVFRNGADVKESDSLEWEDERFNIRFLKTPKNRDLYLQVTAERGVAE